MKPLAEVTPAGTQTYSKRPDRIADNCPPVAWSGRGMHLYADIPGHGLKPYLDYISALGAVILGYSDPDVDDAIVEQIRRGGYSLSLPTQLEGEVAELVCGLFPGAEMVRFQKNGKDACSTAVRLARAVTGRRRVVTIGYHGGDDWTVADTNPRGIPDAARLDLVRFSYGDLVGLETVLAGFGPWDDDRPEDPAACLIMEPVVTADPRLPPPGYLEACRDLCTKTGALLIFDEVVTGLRFPGGSAARYFGVTPDLYAAGKALANGLPLSVVAGPRDFMQLLAGDVFCSTTFGGETLALAAARATITKALRDDVPNALTVFGAELSGALQAHIENAGLQDVVKVAGWAARPVLVWTRPDLRRIFASAMIAQDVLMDNYFNLTAAHVWGAQTTRDRTLEAAVVALASVDAAR